MNQNISKTQETYKDAHIKYSPSAIRNKLRQSFILQKFLSRLQGARRRNIDGRRFSNSTSAIQYKNNELNSFKDLREILLDSKELQDLISADEVDVMLREIEDEIGSEAFDDINFLNAEIQEIVDGLLNTCIICDQYSSSVLCECCANEHFTDDIQV
ncbi:hypothetical protein HHI36_022447 [Cryptolaemus montrouzieri]|uniref:RPA-interacting protein C-terminal domain-containing protein n=1 Tax=Cryptolaemus montrouzieri TaxID=559131 RepID=A0ABD2MZU4_9CUCU